MTQPPVSPPLPSTGPHSDLKPRSSGTVALVFGIILCVIGFFPTVRGTSLLLLSIVRGDAYYFGVAIGTFIGAAIVVVPGILLIRRAVRTRRANRAAEAAAVYGAPPVEWAPPAAAAAAPAAAPTAAYGPSTTSPAADAAPPAPPVPLAPPVPPVNPPA